jgi:hypothetical protein
LDAVANAFTPTVDTARPSANVEPIFVKIGPPLSIAFLKLGHRSDSAAYINKNLKADI